MANSLLPTPNLLRTQKPSLLPLCRFIGYSPRTSSPTRASAQAPARTSAKIRRRPSVVSDTSTCAGFQDHFLLPPLRHFPHLCTACDGHTEQRRGDSGVDWGGSTLGVAEVEDSEEDDNGGMLVDQEIGTDATARSYAWNDLSCVTSLSSKDLSHAIGHSKYVSTSLPYFYSPARPRLRQADPYLVLHVTRGRHSDCLTVHQWKELDQERELVGDLELALDLYIDGEDSIIARIRDFLGENDDILRAKDRKQRNCIFKAIHNGKFEVVLDDFIDPSAYPASSLTAVSPAHHCASTRVLFLSYRTTAAVDPFALTKMRSNKVHEAARQAAAREKVVGHMWRYVEDFGGAATLSLPPMSRHARKSVHELASAFNLKGEENGVARYTRLVKTTLSGVWADERNVALILVKPLSPPDGIGGAREREGRKVHPPDGKTAAPKIDGSNVAPDVVRHMINVMRRSQIAAIGGGELDAPPVAVIS
ncbi:hypothetical protein EDB86DRAFT_3101404 [Lactarius hatsudake]|nr:hypothetical protein EDB86DRAFT_3101404 [Lactarius hatsudake]